jgi:hypothetical protein
VALLSACRCLRGAVSSDATGHYAASATHRNSRIVQQRAPFAYRTDPAVPAFADDRPVAMALVATEHRLSLVLRRWSIFGLPLPLWLGPGSDSYESAEGDRFNFHVKISHPLTGLIVQYDGRLSAPHPTP